VEAAVRIVERFLLGRLRNRFFYSIVCLPPKSGRNRLLKRDAIAFAVLRTGLSSGLGRRHSSLRLLSKAACSVVSSQPTGRPPTQCLASPTLSS
jgi:hypothetical protein